MSTTLGAHRSDGLHVVVDSHLAQLAQFLHKLRVLGVPLDCCPKAFSFIETMEVGSVLTVISSVKGQWFWGSLACWFYGRLNARACPL